LKHGGVYIIEDVHTSSIGYPGCHSPDDIVTTLEMLHTLNYRNKMVSNYITTSEIEYIEQNVESVFVWSRTPKYDQSVTAIIKKKSRTE